MAFKLATLVPIPVTTPDNYLYLEESFDGRIELRVRQEGDGYATWNWLLAITKDGKLELAGVCTRSMG